MMKDFIPYGRQNIEQQDIDAVVRVLESDFLTQGPEVPRFEKALAEKVSAGHAFATNSATSALHSACIALGLGPGDHLWTSPITFVASANCGLYCGAKVDFVDIDPITYNMSADALEKKLIQAQAKGTLPKIVIPVHFAGQSCDMQRIHQLSQEYGFHIIEDASHAIGARYLGDPVGCCHYSDITVFSFHPVKIITAAEGGMALTQSQSIADKLALVRSHGITRAPENLTEPSHGPWYYEQQLLGFNYRMSDLHAALGHSQLSRLDKFVQERAALAEQYHQRLQHLPVTLPGQQPGADSAWHLYTIRIPSNGNHAARDAVFESMREQNIGVNLHYIPVHTQPYYRNMGFHPHDFPNALAFYQEAITLPLYPDLSQSQLDRVCHTLEKALEL